MKDNLTRDEAQERARLLSDVSYRVALDLTTGDETFRSETALRFRCHQPGASTFVDLAAPRTELIELNGQSLPLEAFDGQRIRLPALQAENELRVVAAGAYSRTSTGLHRSQDPADGRVYLYTDFEPYAAHLVYACFDQPDLKATFDFSVIAPAGFEVVSNSPARERPEAGQAGRWTFATTPRLSTYVTAVVAGPYHVVRDRHKRIELGLHARQSLAPYLDADELFDLTRQGFDCFEAAFGYPYVWGKYDQSFVPEYRFGAMENAACITFADQRYLFRSKVTDAARESRAETLLHEMAHMWFGDLVTMRWWDDLWLNESFATFAGVYAQVKATRFKNGWVTFAASKAWAYRQDQLPTTHPITADIPDVAAAELNFDGITYAKGAAVLRQLVAWVGEEAFLRGVRAYFRRFEYQNTTLRDFLTALEETSGRDLGAWSKEWLEQAGVNTLRASFETEGERYTSFEVLQEAPPQWPTLRSHRAAIGLYDLTGEGLVRRRQVELDVVGERTPVPALVGERVAPLVLVNDGDLTYTKIRLDPQSFATVREHLGTLRDPSAGSGQAPPAGSEQALARTLCWSACWQAVRDAALPAREFLPLVLNNVEGEDDIGVLEQLLSQAQSAIVVFGAPRRREPALATLAAHALAALRQAESGSDRQLVWAQSFIAAARSREDLAIVRGLLDGSVRFEGLAVDADLRWQCVRTLAATGASGDDLIDAESQRDETDQGRRQAAAARAARPTAEAKAEAWRAITADTSLPLATLRAIVGGFQQREQQALLRPYVDRYFEQLGPVWRDRSFEVAQTFSSGLYPYAGDEATVRQTDAYLAAEDVPPPLRRILLEGKDDLERALRARQKDATAV